MSSGEPLSEELADRLRAVLPSATSIVNIYGCTEVAADATSYEVQQRPQPRPTDTVTPSAARGSASQSDGVQSIR